MSREIFLSLEEPPDLCKPERNLVRAVLERGIMDFLGMACHPKDRACAEEWIMRDSDIETPEDFSFFHCCEILGVNPLQARRRIAKMAMLPKTSLIKNYSFDAHVRIGQFMDEASKQEGPLPLNYSPGGGKLRGTTQLGMLNEQLSPTMVRKKEPRTSSLATDVKNPRRTRLRQLLSGSVTPSERARLIRRRVGRFAKFQELSQLRRA